jgi:hypothetical protein
VAEVELAYGAVVFKPEPGVDNEVCAPCEFMVLADSVSDTDDAVGFQPLVVLVGKGQLVGCLVMMEVLMSVRLLADVCQEPTELISDSRVFEKL